MISRPQLLTLLLSGLIACGASGCDETSAPAPEVRKPETQSEADVSKAKSVRSPVKPSEKKPKAREAETVSVLVVIAQDEIEVPDYARRDPTVSAEARLEKWRRVDKPQTRSAVKPKLPETTELDDLAAQIEKLTGRSVTTLPSAGTIVAEVSPSQLEEIEAWEHVLEVLPNRKIDLP